MFLRHKICDHCEEVIEVIMEDNYFPRFAVYFEIVEYKNLMTEVIWILANMLSTKHSHYIQIMMDPEYNVLKFLSECMNTYKDIETISCIVYAFNNIFCEQDYDDKIIDCGYVNFLVRLFSSKIDMKILHIKNISWGVINISSNIKLDLSTIKKILLLIQVILNIRDLTLTIDCLKSIEMLALHNNIADECLKQNLVKFVFDLINVDRQEALCYHAVSAAAELVCNNNATLIDKYVEESVVKQLSQIYNAFIPKDSMCDVNVPENHYIACNILKLLSCATKVCPNVSNMILCTNLFDLVLEDLNSETTSDYISCALHFLCDVFEGLDDDLVKHEIVKKDKDIFKPIINLLQASITVEQTVLTLKFIELVFNYCVKECMFNIVHSFGQLDGIKHIENLENHPSADVRMIADCLIQQHFCYDIDFGKQQDYEEYEGNYQFV